MSKRIILMLFLSAFVAINSIHATNVKVTALTEETAPIATDLVGAMVDDPGGTPISKKVTFANLFGSAANIGASTIVTVGIVNAGSVTSGFGTYDSGASTITTTGDITGGTHAATGDTAADDNASMGYTASEGLVLTGQGSTYDVVIKNDADAIVLSILTGTTDVAFAGATDVSSGTVTGPSGTWDTGGIDIATTDTYAIAGTNVIDNATTFSSGMVISSLTTVGALNSGSITSGFTSIDVGAGAILTTGVVTGDSLVATAGTITVADGGTVSQGAGSGRATTVILNTYSGQITTDTTSLAAGDEATFTVTNSVVTALDVVCVSFGDIPDADAMHVISVTATGSGSFEITYSNVSGNADTGANVINFVVLRGASS